MRITANQVTFTRLVGMPFLCWLLYLGPSARLVAVILGTILGCTDFVDGYLARRQGPTVLGGLMDPIADKVFIAIAFLPYADQGWVAWWLVALLFLREFVVTAMRSSFEKRHRTLKTTYLAKVKTWVQMVGLGFLFLLLVEHARVFWFAMFGGITGLSVLGGFLAPIVAKRKWRGAWIFAACGVVVIAVYAAFGEHVFQTFLIAAIVGVTWASGLDYLAVGARELLGDLHAFDVVRLGGAIALPLLAILALVKSPAAAWPIIALVSIEFAHGGLDNLLTHHDAAAPPLAWGGRVLGAAACLALALALPAYATLFAVGAFTISLAGTTVAFWQNRRFYLEAKLREKKRGVAAPAPATTE